MKKRAVWIIEKSIFCFWLVCCFAFVAGVLTLFEGEIGKAGWMGFVYFGLACLSFVVLRVLRLVKEILETPVLEEI